MHMSKFKDGIDHVRNLGLKGLKNEPVLRVKKWASAQENATTALRIG